MIKFYLFISIIYRLNNVWSFQINLPIVKLNDNSEYHPLVPMKLPNNTGWLTSGLLEFPQNNQSYMTNHDYFTSYHLQAINEGLKYQCQWGYENSKVIKYCWEIKFRYKFDIPIKINRPHHCSANFTLSCPLKLTLNSKYSVIDLLKVYELRYHLLNYFNTTKNQVDAPFKTLPTYLIPKLKQTIQYDLKSYYPSAWQPLLLVMYLTQYRYPALERNPSYTGTTKSLFNLRVHSQLDGIFFINQ